jgi:MFS family permease
MGEQLMDWRNRSGLYGAYFLGIAGIGFTLPYLPLYLRQEGLSDRAIGVLSTLAALAGLVQYPFGLWSDRLGRRKPILIGVLTVLAVATVLLHGASGSVWVSLLVLLFAENGACRATVESLAGAEAAYLSPPDQLGAALGALRFWKPISIILVALAGGLIAETWGISAILLPLAIVQALAVVAALLIRDNSARHQGPRNAAMNNDRLEADPRTHPLRDGALWAFAVAMLLFHVANAPGGVYLGLFLKSELNAPDRVLSYAFVVSMMAWMLVVRPAGRWADRMGRRPLLIAGWAAMALRLALIAVAQAPWQVLVIQALDGLANGLFAVLAAAWVTDRLADPRRVGEAQVLVGSSLVLGSAVGPLLSGLIVDALGYRGMFGLLAGIGALATSLVCLLVPETVQWTQAEIVPLATVSDLSAQP